MAMQPSLPFPSRLADRGDRMNRLLRSMCIARWIAGEPVSRIRIAPDVFHALVESDARRVEGSGSAAFVLPANGEFAVAYSYRVPDEPVATLLHQLAQQERMQFNAIIAPVDMHVDYFAVPESIEIV